MGRQRGPIIATILAGLLWGSSFIVVKLGLRTIDPYWFVFLRFAAAAVLALLYAAATGRLPDVLRLLRDPLVVWLGVTNAVGFVFQFQGQTMTTAGKAALFVNSSTIFVAIASRFVFQERFTSAKILAIVAGMVGVALVTTGGSLRFAPGPELLGDALVLAGAVVWTAFILLDKRIVGKLDVGIRSLTAAMVTTTALTALPVALVLGGGGLPTPGPGLWVVGYTAVFCTVVPFLLWTWALRSISATNSCVILLVEIVFALALAAVVFGERLSPGALAGAALIASAVYLASRETRQGALIAIALFAIVGIAAADVADAAPAVPTAANAPSDSLLIRAERALESDDADGAEALYRDLLDRDEDDHRALNGLALVGVARGDADFAIEHARKAVRKHRSSSEYHMTLAMGYAVRLMQGGFSSMFYVGKFKRECEEAIRLDPSNVDAHMALLQYYAFAPGIMGGGIDRARETAGTIAALDTFYGHIATALIAEVEEDTAGAERGYLAAAEVDTANPEGWGALGMFLMRTEQYERAIPVGRRVARLAPDEWEAPYQLGKAYLLLGEDLDEAERWFRAAIDLIEAEQYPNTRRLASAYWRLGMVKERRGDLEAARALWERALAVDEDHEQATAAMDSLITVLPGLEER